MSDLAYYILCGVLAVGVLLGISMMSKVGKAVVGNALSALCTAAAILLTLYKYDILADWMLWLALVIGVLLGLYGAVRVKMIQMPQMVALLNGLGGAASALVAVVSLLNDPMMDAFSRATAGLALVVGMLTLTGSLVAAAKLQGLMRQKPVVLPGHQILVLGTLLLSMGVVLLMALFHTGAVLVVSGVVGILASTLFGVLFAIRVGGADMPITISLLNSFSGVAGAIAGMAISDPLLVAVGGIVGASGLLLTQVMCRAMNRSLGGILLGNTGVSSAKPAVEQARHSQASTSHQPAESVETSEQAAANCFMAAQKVVIVPGYGMAVAQAQSLVKELSDRLQSAGREVAFAIHPVAGRMPGHMNVLLAEVDVSYEKLLELEEANSLLEACDVAVIVGANDVVNPAANTAEGTPIYGMPVLDVEKAKRVVVCNFDARPGYAGVENPLYQMEKTTLLLGDAKDTLRSLMDALRTEA